MGRTNGRFLGSRRASLGSVRRRSEEEGGFDLLLLFFWDAFCFFFFWLKKEKEKNKTVKKKTCQKGRNKRSKDVLRQGQVKKRREAVLEGCGTVPFAFSRTGKAEL